MAAGGRRRSRGDAVQVQPEAVGRATAVGLLELVVGQEELRGGRGAGRRELGASTGRRRRLLGVVVELIIIINIKKII